MNTRSESWQLQQDELPWLARPLWRALERLPEGELAVHTPAGRQVFSGKPNGMVATLHIHDWRALTRIMQSGDIGLAEAWRDGMVSSPDWPALLKLAVANEQVLSSAIHGSWLGTLGYWLRHLFRANTRKGSKRNIQAHYDLGNNFYRLWLDEGMTYSSALFTDAGQALDKAQEAKYERILQRLDARAGQHILEIGCGWGAFAEYAIRTRQVKVTGLTLSHEQLAWARQRLAAAGLNDHADLRLQDYRDVDGQFDHIVSIEMLEAVGEGWWPRYFRTLEQRLKPGGHAVVQVITMADAHFDNYRRNTDFIQQYIFPGGMLPSPAEVSRQAAAAGLMVSDAFAFGGDYARTLRHWLTGFERVLPQVRAQGFDESFIRLWLFYFWYCIAGFEAGRTDVYQFEFLRQA